MLNLKLRFVTRVLLTLMVGCLGGCATGPGGVRPLSKDAAETGLVNCPPRPSCVSSRDTAGIHQIAPIKFEGDGAAAMKHLHEIMAVMPRTKIVDSGDRYIHATQASSVFHFVDDVEFFLDTKNAQIEVRSCARFGFYDFGVNRRRVEKIRSALSPG